MNRDCKHGQLARACDRCADAREIAELKRWKSTAAPRLEALQGLLTAAQFEAHAGREAVLTLASERAANALLTDEVERLLAELAEWHKLREPVTLHVNLLRGIPCRLDRATFLHIAGADQLRAALEEADRIMGHDDAATEWREKWAGLWSNARANARP